MHPTDNQGNTPAPHSENDPNDLEDFRHFDGVPEEVDVGPPAPHEPNEAIDDPHRLARVFVDQRCRRDGDLTTRFWRDDLHEWDGQAYRQRTVQEYRGRLTSVIKAEFDAANVRELEGWVPSKHQKHPPKVKPVTTGLVGNVLQALCSELLLPSHRHQPCWLGEPPAEFKAHEMLATASGLLHLPSLVSGKECLLPATPLFFSPNAVDYGFDADATCPEWLTFLESLWGGDWQSIQLLQEFIGYLLLPDNRLHKGLMLVGPPRSGKGTIARVIKALVGEGNVASPTLSSLSGPFGLWPLLGKSVALITDARLSGRTDAVAVVERILSISGDDPQDVHRKNMPTLTAVKMPVRFVLMSNELPNWRDASGAITTRIVLLAMTKSFLGSEDRKLGSRLEAELPGILNWAIHGWQRLHDRGEFIQPDSGMELLQDLDDLSSPISAFVNDRCFVGPEYQADVGDLFAAWKSWCEEHGRDRVGHKESFCKDLRAKVPGLRLSQSRRDSERVRLYNGIGLKA